MSEWEVAHCLWGGLLKSQPTNGKATGTLLPSHRFKDRGVAVMSSYRVACVVGAGGEKNVYCIDDILPKKKKKKEEKKISKKMYFSL